MTDHHQAHRQSASNSPTTDPRQRFAGKFTVGLFSLLVILPILLTAIVPTEREQWLVAAAQEARREGDLLSAIESLDQLIEQNPGSTLRHQILRARLAIELGDAELSIRYSKSLVEEYPDGLGLTDKKSEALLNYEHYMLLAEAFRLSGDFASAAEQIAILDEIYDGRREPRLINQIAYANALAKRELYPSFENVSKIILADYEEAGILHQVAYLHYLFVSAEPRFHQQNPELRTSAINRAVEAFDAAIEAQQDVVRDLEERRLQLEQEVPQDQGNILNFPRFMSELYSRWQGETANRPSTQEPSDSQRADPPTPSNLGDESTGSSSRSYLGAVDWWNSFFGGNNLDSSNGDEDSNLAWEEMLLSIQKEVGQSREMLAQIIANRALLFEAVEDHENAERDWNTIRELGFSGKKLSRFQLRIDLAMAKTGRLASWIDTRGFLLYQLGQARSARRDLDRAIRCYEGYVSGYHYQVTRRAMETPEIRDELRQLHSLQTGLAVLLYHRMLASEALDDLDAVDQDRRRILELGETPGPHLF